MPRKRRSAPGPHTYSVFVNFRLADGSWDPKRVYFGNSEYSAKLALAEAILSNPHAFSIDVRRDFELLARVYLGPTP